VGSIPIVSTKKVQVRALRPGLGRRRIGRHAHYVPFSIGRTVSESGTVVHGRLARR